MPRLRAFSATTAERSRPNSPWRSRPIAPTTPSAATATRKPSRLSRTPASGSADAVSNASIASRFSGRARRTTMVLVMYSDTRVGLLALGGRLLYHAPALETTHGSTSAPRGAHDEAAAFLASDGAQRGDHRRRVRSAGLLQDRDHQRGA